jgi:hypothetical protein
MAGRQLKVLLLGSSGVNYSDTGPANSLTNLLAAELSRRAPHVTWTCECENIRPFSDMPERVQQAVEREQPDVVYLAPAASYFTYAFVVLRLRRLAPRLYKPAVALSRHMRRLAGGGLEGSPSPRGWLFRGPHWLAERLLGTEPSIGVDDAIENVSASLRYLVKQESLVTLFKVPTMSTDLPADRSAVYGRRLDRFQRALSAVCEERRMPYYELRQAAAAAGMPIERGGDGLHWTLETRKWEAGLLAGLILQHLGLEAASSPDLKPPRTPTVPGVGNR